ncbi:MAG: YfhO family protein [Deltaproteobacteria bacterium]|nr:YfhO family protein [Deltaproteobacteria bacterium]
MIGKPVPGRAAALVLLVLLAAHHDIVFPPAWAWGDDVLEYAVPFSRFVLRSLSGGDTPLWNPHEDCGSSLFHEPAFMGPFYPAFPLFLLPSGWALNLGFMLHVLVGAAGAFVLARRLGQGPLAALGAGFLFGASSSMRINISSGYLPNAVSISWLPWMLAALEAGWAGRARPRGWALAAAACGLSFLGGNAAVSAACLIVAALYGAARIAVPGDGRSRLAAAQYWIPALCVSAAAGLTASAVQILPTAGAIAGSAPGADRALRVFEYLAYEPWRIFQTGVMGANPGFGGSLFAGMTGVVLAVLGASRSAGSAAARVLLFAGGAVYLVFISPWFGAYQAAVKVLSPLLFLGGTYEFDGAIPLFVALLAGAGLQHLLDRGGPDRRDLVAASAAMAAVLLFAIFYAVSYKANPQPRPAAVIVPVAVAVPVLGGALLAWRRRKWPVPAAAAVLVAIAAVEMAAYCFLTRDVAPSRYSDEAFFDRTEVITAAVAATPSYRILPYEIRHVPAAWHIQRNEGMVQGYHSAFGNAKIPTRRFAEFTRLNSGDVILGRRAFQRMLHVRKPPPEVRLEPRDLRLLSMMGVRYIATDAPLAGAGASFWPGPAAGDTRLYENPHALPRAYAVGRTRGVPDDSAALAALSAPDFDPWSEAVLTGGPSLDGGGGCDGVAVAAYRNGLVVIDAVECRGRAALVLADQFDPDWRATVDGVPAAVLPANHLFRGVVVGPGDHRIEFRYAPRLFRAGLFVSAVAWVLIMAAAGWPRGRGRRRA